MFGNNQDNFQLHRFATNENIAFFLGAGWLLFWLTLYNVHKILSPSPSLPILAKTNPPCSVVSLL